MEAWKSDSVGGAITMVKIAHCITVAKDGSVYVGDITGGRIQKFVRDGK
jgi:hypothetical protein